MRGEVVDARLEHIAPIASRVRTPDLEELSALLPVSVEAVLKMSLEASPLACTGLIDGEPVCMFGVVPVSFFAPDEGRPWMVGTSLLDQHAKTFLKGCKPHLDAMRERYAVLENFVDARNVKAIRWLKWLGFTIHPALPMGRRYIPFHRFDLRR
jgi:hypothetical protein